MQSTRILVLAGGLIAAFALGVYVLAPAYGDEAYFVSWGLNPSWGYYDHPPLIGWLSVVLNGVESALGFSLHGRLHRITYVLLGIATWLGLWRFLRIRFAAPAYSSDFGALVLAVAALPASLVMFGVYFNDTLMGLGLLVFLVATDVALRADRARWGMVALAGIGLGAALLTKYIAGLFFIAMVLYLVSHRAGRRYLFGRFLLTSLLAGLLFLPNLIWNLNNCNVNLAFNFAYRGMEPGLRGLPLFGIQILLVLGPTLFFLAPALWRALRQRRLGYYAVLFGLIFLLTGLVAISRGTYRFNWGLPYVLFALLAAAELLDRSQIRRLIRWNLGFLVVFLGPLLLIFALDRAALHPLDRLAGPKDVALFNLDMDLADGTLVAAIAPLAAGKVVATANYGQTALLRNHGLEAVDFPTRQDFQVFGRNYDLFTDYAALEGRDFVFIFDQLEGALAMANTVFDRIEQGVIQGKRAAHPVIYGYGFRFEAYRTAMILPAMARFYDRHSFHAQSCYMDRYRVPR